MSRVKFAAAINCMDGRVQLPIAEWMKKEYGIDYVDMITEPGPNRILAERKESHLLESIKNRLDISVNKHASGIVAIAGHHDCAGNPTDKAAQLAHISAAVRTVESWKFNVDVIGLWVDEDWKVHKVA